MKHYNLYAKLNGDWRQYAIDYEGELLGKYEAPVEYDGGIEEAIETVRRSTVPGLLKDPSIDTFEVTIVVEELSGEGQRNVKETTIELGYKRAEDDEERPFFDAVQTSRHCSMREYTLED